jgi:hypothetical protein
VPRDADDMREEGKLLRGGPADFGLAGSGCVCDCMLQHYRTFELKLASL